MFEAIERLLIGVAKGIAKCFGSIRYVIFKIINIFRIIFLEFLRNFFIAVWVFLAGIGRQIDAIFPLAKVLVMSALIAFSIRFFVIEPYRIPSGSMEPNLLIKDFILVSKLSYGYGKYSFPGAKYLTGENRLLQSKEPKRGDIIVFRLPASPKISYVKRLIGLPNDRIRMENGYLYINDVKVEKVALNKEFIEYDAKTGNTQKSQQYSETLEGKTKIVVLDSIPDGPFDNTEEFTVPENYYFFMGDNRDHSLDSRSVKVGFIPKSHLIGKVRTIFFSLDPQAMKEGRWYKSLRWDRMFTRPM